ncbi:MAG: 23S rRNA (adenine(2503)-C(2))-methyltransferase RlmN [Anaerolineales bacterium]|nr:23S rRNA (adenine(2503)-C(2))-methyltransferase RlmN [Anaerolineales bacterium]
MQKELIYNLSLSALTDLLKSWGEPAYRSRQVWNGLYQSLWSKPEEFSNIPKSLRQKLLNHLSFSHLTPATTLDSTDGETQKTLFRLPDNRPIETVRMRYANRRTLCISTQSGCAMGCVFCATGQMGFLRNLTAGEIIEQVLYYSRQLATQGERVTNVVFMGMGEPFQNYDNVLSTIHRLNDSESMNFGARRFTISTVGLIPAIQRFTAERSQVNLAVSLHAANDELRSSMLPVNKKYPLNKLMAALREYAQVTKRRITFEWALIQGVNDSPEQAYQLAGLLHGMLAHVNVIPLNPTAGFQGKGSTSKNAKQFQSILESKGIPCTIRIRRGIDIHAGCGQLASKDTKILPHFSNP